MLYEYTIPRYSIIYHTTTKITVINKTQQKLYYYYIINNNITQRTTAPHKALRDTTSQNIISLNTMTRIKQCITQQHNILIYNVM